MANKLDKEYTSIKATKALLKLNPEIKVDQVKGYDRRARTSPFMMEHVKIIQSLTDDNESLLAKVFALQASEAVLMEKIDDLKYDMDNDLYTEEDLTELKEGWGEVLQDEIAELKAENQKIKDEHKKFDEIWKTECITEQDIIDMKRQISDQCDLIKELKAKFNQK